MHKFLIFALASVLLQGCVTGDKRTPFTAQTVQSITSANSYNLVIQDEVRPAVDISNVAGAMGGGLIGAIVDSSINKSRNRSAQEVMNEFYALTQDHDFRAHVAADFNAALASALPLKVAQAPAEFILLSNKARAQRINKLAAGEVLIYSSSFYGFVDNSKELVTESVVYVYAKPAKRTKSVKPIYFNRFVYLSESKGSGPEDSISLWSANKGEVFREEIRKSTAAVAELIAMDMNARVDKFCGRPVKASMVFLGQVAPGNATLVKENGDRTWVQAASGELYSVPSMNVTANPKGKAVKCA